MRIIIVERLRILFATTVLPDPTRSGGEVVSAAFVAALGRTGADVDVMGYARPDTAVSAPPPGERRHEIGRRAIESAGASRWQRGRWLARALLTGDAYSVAKYRSRAY
ncbi:MAG: hypothetical protein JWM71_1005, partial [Solirubrobacteraceae bacterium]|nr:hypothetical protein [Solirubrobacteraceae bacterium]